MHSYILAFAVVALATPALDAAAQETEHVTRTVKLDPGGTLRLKNFSGRVIDHRDGPARGRHRRRPPRPARTARTDQARHPHRRSERRRRRREPPRLLLVRAHRRQQRRRNRFRHQGAAPDQPRRRGVQLAGDCRRGGRLAQGPQLLGAGCTLNDVTGPVRAHTFSGARGYPREDLGDGPDHRGRHLQRRRRAARARLRPRQRLLQLLQRPSEFGDAAHACTARSRRSLRAELGGGGDGRCASRPSAAASGSTVNY